MAENDQKKIRDMVGKTRFAMMTTIDGDGSLVSRPMTQQEIGDDWTMLFITQRGQDVAQQADGKQVNLAFADGNDFVSISGVGEIRDDVEKKKELWNPWNDAYCEGGPENPDNVILAIKCDSARYWDSPSKPVALVAMLKSAITGDDTAKNAGDAGTVQL